MRHGGADCSLAGIATIAIFCVLAPPVLACGYEDPQSIAIGALNLAFPDSLHLRTAIWQAQIDGVLPRDQVPVIAPSPPVNSSPRSFAAPGIPLNAHTAPATDPAKIIALMEALRVIEQARLRLASSPDTSHRPTIAMVYASKMLWTRFVGAKQGVTAQTHASGPESGDVVMITEPLVIQALVAGALSPAEAFQRKLIRLYGDEAASASAQQWLLTLASPSTILLTKE